MIREAIDAVVEGHSLTMEEAASVMREIMDGEASPAQLADFLTALRLKGETTQEIAGVARVMRQMALEQLRRQAATENVRITQHAHREMVEEEITLDELLEAIVSGQVLEDYPEYRRGACCLVNGTTNEGRPLHIVCTTALPVLIIITAYEPKAPKWVTPVERNR